MNNLIVKNASQIVTSKGNHLHKGKEMAELSIIENGCLIAEDGKIKAVGGPEILDGIDESKYEVIDAEGKTVLPGFCDSHTHFIFGGYREDEFTWRLNGDSYMSIMERGGGISSTTKATRATSLEEFIDLGKKRIKSFLRHGVTTVEGKSGYGLDLDTEIRQLKAYKELNELPDSINIVPTYMGPHDIPEEYKGRNSEFIDFCLDEVLPVVKKENLAKFCDIFTEKGVFNIEESRKYLEGCKKTGFPIKMHADEIAEGFGGAELAGEMKCVSADHLLQISDEGIKALRDNGVSATLLPLTAFSIKSRYAPARKIIDMGGAVSLATDFNPGSCYSESIPLIIALSAIHMEMSPEEIITALTINGASALLEGDTRGTLEPGKYADIAIFDVPNYRFLTYHFAVNECIMTISEGRVLYKREK